MIDHKIVLESISDCFFALDGDWRFVYMNKAAEKHFGFLAGEVLGKDIFEAIPETKGSILEEKYREALRTQLPVRFETHAVINDGWVGLDVFPSEEGLLVYFRDITARRADEKRIVESENQLRLITDSMPLLIAYIDTDYRYRYVNRAYTDWFGKTNEEVAGKTMTEVLGPDAFKRLLPHVDAALAGTRHNFETEIPYIAGGTRFVRAVYTPDLNDGKVQGIFVLVTDITAEQRALEIGERYRLLSMRARDKILFLNADTGAIVEANESAAKAYGYDLESLVKMNIRDLRATETLPSLAHQYEAAFKSGTQFETVHRRSDGTTFPVEVSATRAEVGGQSFIISIIRDVSERKAAEDELRASDDRFRLALASGAVTVYEQDLDLRYKWVYPEGPYRADLIGKTDEELSGGPDADKRNELKRHVLETGESVRGEVAAVVFGEKRWFDLLIEARRGPDGNINGIGGTALDITERKRLQQSLLDSEERFRGLMEQAPFSVQILNPNGRTESVNRAWEELWGAEMEQLADYNILEDPQLQAGGVAAFLRRAFEGEAVELPEIQYDPDKSIAGPSKNADPVRWVSAVAYPLKGPDGEVREVALIHQNITDRKRDEEALRESENTLRTLADSIPQLAWMAEPDGAIFWYNRRWYEYTGANPGQLEGWEWQSLHDPKILPHVNKGWKESLATGSSFEMEFPLRGSDGVFRWFLTRVNPLRDSQGKIIRWFGTNTDIDDSRRIREALSESEERFSKAFASSPMSLTISSLDTGELIEVNETFVNITGFSREEAIGKTTADLGVWKQRDDREGQLEAVRTYGGNRNVEYTFRTKNGQEIIGLLSAERIEIGGKSFALTTIHDITDRKRAEEALVKAERRAAEEYYSLLSRIVPLAQVLGTARDLTSIYRSVNEFVTGSMPCSGFFISFYDADTRLRTAVYVSGPDGEIDTSALPPMKLTTKGGPNSRAVFERKPVMVNNYAAMMKDRPHIKLRNDGIDPQSSVAVPMIVMNRVIGTLEVQAYESGAFQREHLVALEMIANLAAVAIENVRLIEVEAEARVLAESANQSKDEFLSILSHELRTPLNSMLGWTNMLRSGMLDEAQSSKALEVIERNTKQQSELIEDLLDVSRIISGQMRIETEMLDLVSIVRESSEAFKPTAAAKNIGLEFSGEAKAVLVDGDPVRLQQVITNLLQNAVKFTSPQGAIAVSISKADGFAQVAVKDSGIGIEAEFLPFIFDRFRQADASVKRSFSGLGLGLTIVKTIVELHGGTMKVKSGGKNEGSEFIFSIPLAEEFSAGDNRSEAIDPKYGPGWALEGIRILLVDDDSESLGAIRIFLEQQKAMVSSAASAIEALQKLKTLTFDVMVSDIGMPVMDGYQLLSNLRSSAGGLNTNVPAIALTAYASAGDKELALDAGFQTHLSKPINFDALLSALQTLYQAGKE